uniref:Reverse transcriptase domain-containing protein n=1 Tax=Arundo donax TaxID=35708 RepID=A0A0A9GRJ6_ARUDO
MIQKAQSNGLVTGLIPHLFESGIAVLQYADDTILCLQHDCEKANNMKLLLYLYELMSGLKINFQKSEVIVLGGNNVIAQQYADLFHCQVGSFPIKYLGVPISPSRLYVVDWEMVDQKVMHMSMFLLPKTVIKN